MEGRWTIRDAPNARGGRSAHLLGPEVPAWTPVVPCDDAAIERAASEMASWSGPVPSGVDGFRPFAERVLRAAAEVPR